MSAVLLQRIAELERKRDRLRSDLNTVRKSRDLWRLRAMQSERNQTRPRRRKAAA